MPLATQRPRRPPHDRAWFPTNSLDDSRLGRLLTRGHGLWQLPLPGIGHDEKVPTMMVGAVRRDLATARTRHRLLRAALSVVAVTCALAACAQSSASAGTTSTTRPSTPSRPLSLTHAVRVGQPFVTPGHKATQGPVGANPSKAHGIELTVLNGLLHGEPIFNADFADPFALVVG
ncbi:MAG: hypothetical protein ABSE98_08800, partial [Acidimicrobiales bacterium]